MVKLGVAETGLDLSNLERDIYDALKALDHPLMNTRPPVRTLVPYKRGVTGMSDKQIKALTSGREWSQFFGEDHIVARNKGGREPIQRKYLIGPLKRQICECCKKDMAINTYTRWHGPKCKGAVQ
jgi:hypothetical protein